jgi:dTDP-6-deoxy-L-talose 4-dehydrogenase (NAD+)
LIKTGGIIMRILITGANGYIGQGVTKVLLDEGFDVVATDMDDTYIDPRAHRILCNIFEIDDPFKYFKNPDAILHLAWRDGFTHNSVNHAKDLFEHFLFLKKLIDGGIKKVCVMGSVHEVGFYEGSIDEHTLVNPQSLYGISKNALRQYVQLLCQETGVIFQWIRGFYIVGNTESGCSIFSKITQAEKDGKVEFPFTLGTNQFDFIDYDQYCYQVASVVEQNVINGIINCCSGVPMRLSERVEQFILENKYKINLKYGAFPDRPYDSKAIWGNDYKIREILRTKEHKS